jgi:hypothetical protein
MKVYKFKYSQIPKSIPEFEKKDHHSGAEQAYIFSGTGHCQRIEKKIRK